MSSKKNIYQKKKEIKSKFSKKRNFRNDKKSLKRGGQTFGIKTLIGATVAALALGSVSSTNQSLKSQIQTAESNRNLEESTEQLVKERKEREKKEIEEEGRKIMAKHLEALNVSSEKPDPTNPYTTDYNLNDQDKLEKSGKKEEFKRQYDLRMISLIRDGFDLEKKKLKIIDPLNFKEIFDKVELTGNQQKFYRDNHTIFKEYFKDKDKKSSPKSSIDENIEDKLRVYRESLYKGKDTGPDVIQDGFPGYSINLDVRKAEYEHNLLLFGNIAILFHKFIDEHPQRHNLNEEEKAGFFFGEKKSKYITNRNLLDTNDFKEFIKKNFAILNKKITYPDNNVYKIGSSDDDDKDDSDDSDDDSEEKGILERVKEKLNEKKEEDSFNPHNFI